MLRTAERKRLAEAGPSNRMNPARQTRVTPRTRERRHQRAIVCIAARVLHVRHRPRVSMPAARARLQGRLRPGDVGDDDTQSSRASSILPDRVT